MRLEIESIDIKRIKVGTKKPAADRTLFVDLEEIKKTILSDKMIKSVEIDIAYPGEKTRIVNVVDIIQPRCKISEDDSDFPGYLGKMTTAGSGKTRSLRGVIVVLSNSHTHATYGSDRPIKDMFGDGAEKTRYKGMIAVNVHPIPYDDWDELDFSYVVKRAGLKTAVYLARAAEGLSVDETEIYDLDMANLPKSDLPRIVYYYQYLNPQYDYMSLPEPVLYGAKTGGQFPNIIHPNECLDGGIVNPYSGIQFGGGSTYNIQNNAIIKELYKRHGKELVFAGVVIGVTTVDSVERERRMMMTINLITNVLRVDGVVCSQVLGGAARLEPETVAVRCEKLGIKSVLYTMPYGQFPLSSTILSRDKSLSAIVNTGNCLEEMRLGKADKILGGSPDTPIAFEPKRPYKVSDESIVTKGVCGRFDLLGGTKIMAAEY
ncbi:MAG: glycine/sarcosine/betaine reductase component B subunit [Dehalococcoidia bacterium]